jgi:hypothetical protein
VIVCLSLFTTNHLALLSVIAILGGLYFLFVGFRLLARKRLLLATPTSKIQNALLGLVEINGVATGPNSMPAPITGKPCFLYHTTISQLRAGKKQEWEKIAEETLHLPFFVDDSTGRLLIEPLGADLDLHPGFRQEYDPSFFSSNAFSNDSAIPPRVSVFLSRHGIVPSRRLRVEEQSIKSDDSLFIAGMLTENPGVQVRPFSPFGDSARDETNERPVAKSPDKSSAPQIIHLSRGSDPSSTRDMSQQAKIAAALNRAGITKAEAWSAAGVPYQPIAVPVAVEDNAQPTTSPHATNDVVHDRVAMRGARIHPDAPKRSEFDAHPPLVLMKGADDSTFAISFRSQKEFLSALAWKSGAMLISGFAITLLGVYVLLSQMKLL